MQNAISLPDELRGVSRPVLEAYVMERTRQLVRIVAERLAPQAPAHEVDAAFVAATQALGLQNNGGNNALDNCTLKFRHRCRFIGCLSKDCMMCKNNPNKRCKEDDSFDECYADNQILRAKCEADIHLEVTNTLTGLPQHVPGLEVQVCVIDGESWSDSPTAANSQARKLLRSDEGDNLLNSTASGIRPDSEGFLSLKLQDGTVRLPDLTITDKNDTFHLNGESFGSFRLMAVAVNRDLYGRLVRVDNLPIAVSNKFVVKTQRALNDYRKSEYPHYKDELTKLKFIGSITAQRLREIQAHLGYDVPFTSIETVEQLKHLMLYADQNRQVESKLLELLNMKGKHKQKWDYLREILAEKIVYDDMLHRAWYADESCTQGLLYACKQGQVNMDKPLGMFRRVQQGMQMVVQVYTHTDPNTADILRNWRQAAEQAWASPGHGRWSVVTDRIDLMSQSGPALVLASPVVSNGPMGGTISPSMSVQDAMDDQALYARHSVLSSPHSRSDTPPDRQRRISHGVHSMGHTAMDAAANAALQSGLQPGLAYPFHHVAGSPTPGNMSPGSMPEMYSRSSGPSGIDPATGMLVTYSPSGIQPHTMMGMHQTSNMSPRSEPLMTLTVEGYRSTSIRSRDEERPSRNSRIHRRLSADTPGAGTAGAAAGLIHPVPSMPGPHTYHSTEGLYSQSNHQDMFQGMLKRPRTSAPNGLDGAEELQAMVRSNSAMHPAPLGGVQSNDHGRSMMYRYESQGRHMPRGRKSQENLAASDTQSIAGVFDQQDLEIDNMLRGMEASNGFDIKQEQLSEGGVTVNLHQMHMLQHERNSGGMMQQQHASHLTLLGQPIHTGLQGNLQGNVVNLQPQRVASVPSGPHSHPVPLQHQPASLTQPSLSWHSNELTAGIQNALNLAEPSPQHVSNHQSQHSNSDVITSLDGRPNMMMMQDQDSFGRLNRMLRRSDSDSFKHLFSSMAPPAQYNGDPCFDKALQDIIQGRTSTSM